MFIEMVLHEHCLKILVTAAQLDQGLTSLQVPRISNVSHTFCNRIARNYLSMIDIGPTYGPSKIAKPAIFQAVLRGIGKSFQSAITAPRMNLTGYGNATAQS